MFFVSQIIIGYLEFIICGSGYILGTPAPKPHKPQIKYHQNIPQIKPKTSKTTHDQTGKIELE